MKLLVLFQDYGTNRHIFFVSWKNKYTMYKLYKGTEMSHNEDTYFQSSICKL